MLLLAVRQKLALDRDTLSVICTNMKTALTPTFAHQISSKVATGGGGSSDFKEGSTIRPALTESINSC